MARLMKYCVQFAKRSLDEGIHWAGVNVFDETQSTTLIPRIKQFTQHQLTSQLQVIASWLQKKKPFIGDLPKNWL